MKKVGGKGSLTNPQSSFLGSRSGRPWFGDGGGLTFTVRPGQGLEEEGDFWTLWAGCGTSDVGYTDIGGLVGSEWCAGGGDRLVNEINWSSQILVKQKKNRDE